MKAFHGYGDDFFYEYQNCPQGSFNLRRGVSNQNASRMTGLENPLPFALQKSNKIDR
jgi:hypothetical protein